MLFNFSMLLAIKLALSVPTSVFYGKHNINILISDGRFCEINYSHFTGDTNEFHGDNRNLIATDAIKNNLYEWLRKNKVVNMSIEQLSLGLVEQLSHYSPMSFQQRVTCVKNVETRSDTLCMQKNGESEYSQCLRLVKFSGSSFENYIIDEFTKLLPTDDRPLLIENCVFWNNASLTFDDMFRLMHNHFHRTNSSSVQHMIALASEEMKVRPVRFQTKNFHYTKLSPDVIVPLNNEYGHFNVTFA